MRCDWKAAYRTVLKDFAALPPGERSREYTLDELFAFHGWAAAQLLADRSDAKWF